MTRISQQFPILLLAVLASLTFWLSSSIEQGDRVAETMRHDPDYIIEKVVAHRMGAKGEIQDTLHAERVTHYPDDDTTHLDMPRLVTDASTRAPLTVTSRTARLSSGGGEDVFFEENVRVVRAAYDNRSALHLETDFLHVIPNEHIARTNRLVRITDDYTVATAIGLELNSETRVIKFLSQFKGTHDPNRAGQRR